MDALHTFLLRRIGHLLAVHPPRTEEHRAADALHRAVKITWGELEDCYDFLHRGEEDMEVELGETWDRLRLFSRSWNGTPDYDESLWPPIRYAHLLFTATPMDHEERPRHTSP
ncbi:hypothetical protein [Streptomyces sp. NPDC097981]|uniref:hypothetical protein n=1 Tax=Streptomyces sp. NPDC097981 TaxID=3155428 RepID=UPI003332B128